METSTLIVPPCYPARPVNGGPFPKAQPKYSDGTLEGKYNGWRAWVHNRTSAMFNRHLEPLSINREFMPALETLTKLPWEWSDVEALERRHNIGRGSLILLDYPPDEQPKMTYRERKAHIHICAAIAGGIEVHDELDKPIANDRVYLPATWPYADGARLWNELQAANKKLGAEFWEGFVWKRNDSIYPRQNRSGDTEFPFWMKHRWDF
jgi:hypothetical protein